MCAWRSGEMEALVLEGPGAIAGWRALMGPTHPPRARITAPHSLRALYGISDTRNSCHGSGLATFFCFSLTCQTVSEVFIIITMFISSLVRTDSEASAAREVKFFFPEYVLTESSRSQGLAS